MTSACDLPNRVDDSAMENDEVHLRQRSPVLQSQGEQSAKNPVHQLTPLASHETPPGLVAPSTTASHLSLEVFVETSPSREGGMCLPVAS